MNASLLRICAALMVALGACSSTKPDEPVAPTTTPTATPTTESAEAKMVRNPELDDDLIRAAWDDDVPAARDLIARGASVNAQDQTQQSAFLIAASEGHDELLTVTLENGADVSSLDSYDGTALIRSAERGHALASGRLIQADVDIDHVNRLGWVALHEALVFARREESHNRAGPVGYVDTVRVLIAGGADLTIASTRDGKLPLQLAREHDLSAQASLIERATKLPSVSSAAANDALLNAAKDGDADAAALAVRQGADLEARNRLEQTPLLLASAHDRTDVARLLVALGADPDAVDYRADTPWLVTGVTGSVDMLEVLLPANPDLTARNRYGGLSPIPAAERGHVDYLRRVVQTDVDLDHVNDLGWTALLEAVILGDGSERYQQVVRTLVDAGADTSIPDGDGVTAGQHARNRGFTEIAAILK